MKHRVVITGMGLCTQLGRSVDEFWRNLLAGQSGISRISLFDTSSLPVRIGGEVKNFRPGDLLEQFPEAESERDRKIWLGLDAAASAVANSPARRGDTPSNSTARRRCGSARAAKTLSTAALNRGARWW